MPLRVVTVPTNHVVADFQRLAIRHRCKKKVQFEVLFKFHYVVPEIEEREIWTGFNADDRYGNTREAVFEQARLRRQGLSTAERKKAFDQYRQEVYAESDRPDFLAHVAVRKGTGRSLRQAAPGILILDPGLRQYLSTFDHDQLSPRGKPIVREALAPYLADLPANSIAKGVRLQIGGRVDELFLTLLANPDINRFETKYTTASALCQRWGREIEANPATFVAELDGLPQQPRAPSGVSRTERIPTLHDGRRACRASGTQVHGPLDLRGRWRVVNRLLVRGRQGCSLDDFVREAARTYRINFPDCTVDQRDIREISVSDEDGGGLLGPGGTEAWRTGPPRRLASVQRVQHRWSGDRRSGRAASLFGRDAEQHRIAAVRPGRPRPSEPGPRSSSARTCRRSRRAPRKSSIGY